jgi:large subunit ribosomal protein L15
MFLENITKRTKRVGKAKRLGRGYGSGVGGHVVGRGMKGQKSRSGHKSLVFFEGGNLPFFKRIPKYKGFKRHNKVKFQSVNLSVLEENYKANEAVTIESLQEKGLVRKRTKYVKILGNGEVTKKIKIVGLPVSKSASDKVLAAGGSIE